MRIELLRTRIGIGEVGQVMEVSEERADRWCREGIAKLYAAAPPPEPSPEPADESEAPPEKHRRSRK